jgi:hypothetical protein
MKALWITVAATIFLLLIWGIFLNSASTDVADMLSDIDSASFYAAAEEWGKSSDALDKVYKRWFDRRLLFSMFFDAVSIKEIESVFAKAGAYIMAEEKGSAAAELADLRHLILFIYENETISIENIM